MNLSDAIWMAVIGGAVTLIVGLVPAVAGFIALIRASKKQSLDESAIINKISLNLIAPLSDRISSLESEKINWQLERAVLVKQISDRDAVISDLRSIAGKLVGGITLLVDQLRGLDIKPSFELSDEMLEELKHHVSKSK